MEKQLKKLGVFLCALTLALAIAPAFAGRAETTPYDISKCTVALANPTEVLVYNGAELKPAVVVTFGSTKLNDITDYKVEYANNINAGTATVKVTGIGNNTGTNELPFTIAQATQTLSPVLNPKTLKYGKTSTITVNGAQGALSFKSSKPSIATVNKKGVLKGKKTGKTVITITSAATANYQAATFQLPVTVKGIELTSKNAKIKLSRNSYTYNGSKRCPTLKVTYKGKTLKKNRDYKVGYKDNKNAGKAIAYIKGINKYSGTVKKAFKIIKANNSLKTSISKTSILNKETSKIKVKKAHGEVTFKSSKTSVASVSENGLITGKKTGKVTITVTAAGDLNHKKAVKKYTVSVGPKKLTDSKCKVSLSRSYYVYNGSSKKPDVTVRFDGVKLKQGRDYSVSYDDNVDAGKGKVILKGKGNYQGTRTVSFTIDKAEQSSFSISLPDNHIPLGGQARVIASDYRGNLSYGSGEFSYAKPVGKGYFQGLKKTKNYVTIYVTASGDENYKSTTRSLRVKIY